MPHDSRDDQARLRQPAADETALRGRGSRADEPAMRGAALPGDETDVRRPPDETSPRRPPDETSVRRPPDEAALIRPADEISPGRPPDETSVRRPLDEAALRRPPDVTLMRPGVSASPPSERPVPRQQVPFGQGYRLRGRYELNELIGQGAMGQVWRAKDLLAEEALDRNPYMAVKVLNSDFEARPDAFIALHREATRAQKLAHPTIVTVHVFDRDEQSGRAFIAMELLDGQPLDRVIREAGPRGLPREQAMPIIRGMAEGLAYAHRKGIVHSDFKPANVFITKDGTPKILDFGIARAVQVVTQLTGIPMPDSVHAATDDSGFQGYTVNYAAPEALSGAAATTSEDVFALGIVAYELASGSHPFNRMSALEAQATNLARPPLRNLKRRECNVIEKALQYDRTQRFADAAAFLRQLQGIPVIQQALVAAVAILVVTAGILWYRNYADSLPDQPLEQLPAQVQRDFHEQVRQGQASLDYIKRTHDITASQDAAEYFGNAYRLHEKDRQAVSGLEAAADYAIEWYRKLPDQHEARVELERFRAKSDFYQNYGPLQKAIRAAGGE